MMKYLALFTFILSVLPGWGRLSAGATSPDIAVASAIHLSWTERGELHLSFCTPSYVELADGESLRIEPVYIGAHGQTAEFASVIYLNRKEKKFFERRRAYAKENSEIKPYLLFENKSEKKEKEKRKEGYEPSAFRYTDTRRVSDNTRPGKLVIRYIYTDCCKDFFLAADTVNVPARTSKCRYLLPLSERNLTFFRHPSGEKRTGLFRAQLRFRHDRYDIDPDFGKNREILQRLDSFCRPFFAHPERYRIHAFNVTGYASPEGTTRHNLELSERRARSLARYLKEMYAIGDSLLAADGNGEDWRGLRKLVMTDSLTKDAKSVTELINREENHEIRKLRLSALNGGETYRLLLERHYPSLRRIEIEMEYEVEPDDRRDIHLPPDDDTPALIETSSDALLRYDLDTAWRCLEKAGGDGRAWNNRGVYHWIKGDTDEAERCFLRAMEHTPDEAKRNLKLLQTWKESKPY